MPEQDESHNQLETYIRRQFGNDISVATNSKQKVIIISEDRLLLRAKEFERGIKSIHELGFPTGVFLGIVTTYVTADFHQALWLSKEMWSAIFLLVGLVSLGFIIRGVYRLLVHPSVKYAEQFVKQLSDPSDSSK